MRIANWKNLIFLICIKIKNKILRAFSELVQCGLGNADTGATAPMSMHRAAVRVRRFHLFHPQIVHFIADERIQGRAHFAQHVWQSRMPIANAQVDAERTGDRPDIFGIIFFVGRDKSGFRTIRTPFARSTSAAPMRSADINH